MREIEIDPQFSDTLYATTIPGTIFRSLNRGGSWTELANAASTIADPVLSLAINPLNSAVIYASTLTKGVYKTVNRGSTWTATGLTGRQVDALLIVPSDTSRIYAGTLDSLYKSTDGGVSWSSVVVDTASTVDVTSLAVNPLRPDSVIYVGTDGRGVYRSTGGGDTTWVRINTELTHLGISSLIVHPSRSDTLYAATFGGGVFRSVDAGNRWVPVNQGLSELTIHSLVIAPSNPVILYAGAQNGRIFKSSDDANTWVEITRNLGQSDAISDLAVDPDSANVIYAGLTQVYRLRQIGLAERQILPTPAEPSVVAQADFDGNGFSDPVVASRGEGTLTFLLNQEQGTLFSSRKVIIGGRPATLSTGDLDGDGDADLVAGNRAGQVAMVLFNDGSGGFSKRFDLFIGYPPVASVVADMDGDGLLDIVTANATPGNNISLFLNIGTGNFAAQQLFPCSANPSDLAVADFDRDGLPDVLTANGDERSIGLLRNLGGAAFGLPEKIQVQGRPLQLLAEDLDLDGDADGVVLTSGPDRFVVLRNRGDGTFSVENNGLGFSPVALRSRDADRDRYPDLVISGSNESVRLLINNGRGGFDLPQQTFDEARGVGSLSLGDLDGDGDPDLLSLKADTQTLFIKRNDLAQNIKLPAPPRRVAAADVQGDLGGRIRVSWQMPRADEETGRVTRYRVFRASASGGPYRQLAEAPVSQPPVLRDSLTVFRAFIDSTALVEQGLYYTLDAVGPNSATSARSDTVSSVSRSQPFFVFEFSGNQAYHVGDSIEVGIALIPLDYAISGVSLYIDYDSTAISILDALPNSAGMQPLRPADSVLRSGQVLENRLNKERQGGINYSIGSFAASDTNRIALGVLRFLARKNTLATLTVVDSPSVNRRTSVIEQDSDEIVLPYISPSRYFLNIIGVRLTGRVRLQGRERVNNVPLRLDLRRPNGSVIPDTVYRASNDLDQNPANGVQVLSGASGEFSLVQVPAGRYAVFVKSFHYLRGRVVNDSVTVGTTSPTPFSLYWRSSTGKVVRDTLPGGDANDDNRINLSDFGILATHFGATGVVSGQSAWRADFNGDGAVDLADFGILASNFGETGMGLNVAFKPAAGSGVLAVWPEGDGSYSLRLRHSEGIAGFSAAIRPPPGFDGRMQVVPGGDLRNAVPAPYWIHRGVDEGRILVAAHRAASGQTIPGGAELIRVRTRGDPPVFEDLWLIDLEGTVWAAGAAGLADRRTPERPALYPNVPNPFNPSTTIRFDVSERADVRLVIYNVLGQEVRTLVREEKVPGIYSAAWDGTDSGGRPAASGVYLSRISIGSFRDVKKLLLLR